MAKGVFPIDKLQSIQTPFYYYDADLLRKTLRAINDVTTGITHHPSSPPVGGGRGGAFNLQGRLLQQGHNKGVYIRNRKKLIQ